MAAFIFKNCSLNILLRLLPCIYNGKAQVILERLILCLRNTLLTESAYIILIASVLCMIDVTVFRLESSHMYFFKLLFLFKIMADQVACFLKGEVH